MLKMIHTFLTVLVCTFYKYTYEILKKALQILHLNYFKKEMRKNV